MNNGTAWRKLLVKNNVRVHVPPEPVSEQHEQDVCRATVNYLNN